MSVSALGYTVEIYMMCRNSVKVNRESFGNPGNLLNGSGISSWRLSVVFEYPIKALF